MAKGARSQLPCVAVCQSVRGRLLNESAQADRACLTAVGFEPKPFRTGALSQRLRPLGQTVDACRRCGWELAHGRDNPCWWPVRYQSVVSSAKQNTHTPTHTHTHAPTHQPHHPTTRAARAPTRNSGASAGWVGRCALRVKRKRATERRRVEGGGGGGGAGGARVREEGARSSVKRAGKEGVDVARDN